MSRKRSDLEQRIIDEIVDNYGFFHINYTNEKINEVSPLITEVIVQLGNVQLNDGLHFDSDLKKLSGIYKSLNLNLEKFGKDYSDRIKELVVDKIKLDICPNQSLIERMGVIEDVLMGFHRASSDELPETSAMLCYPSYQTLENKIEFGKKQIMRQDSAGFDKFAYLYGGYLDSVFTRGILGNCVDVIIFPLVYSINHLNNWCRKRNTLWKFKDIIKRFDDDEFREVNLTRFLDQTLPYFNTINGSYSSNILMDVYHQEQDTDKILDLSYVLDCESGIRLLKEDSDTFEQFVELVKTYKNSENTSKKDLFHLKRLIFFDNIKEVGSGLFELLHNNVNHKYVTQILDFIKPEGDCNPYLDLSVTDKGLGVLKQFDHFDGYERDKLVDFVKNFDGTYFRYNGLQAQTISDTIDFYNESNTLLNRWSSQQITEKSLREIDPFNFYFAYHKDYFYLKKKGLEGRNQRIQHWVKERREFINNYAPMAEYVFKFASNINDNIIFGEEEKGEFKFQIPTTQITRLISTYYTCLKYHSNEKEFSQVFFKKLNESLWWQDGFDNKKDHIVDWINNLYGLVSDTSVAKFIFTVEPLIDYGSFEISSKPGNFSYNRLDLSKRELNRFIETYQLCKNQMKTFFCSEDELNFNKVFVKYLNESLSYADTLNGKKANFNYWVNEVNRLVREDPEMFRTEFMQTYKEVGA